MKLGTRSLLFGAHQFILHPIFLALAWWRLYGAPLDPRLWLAFVVHDWGYWGKADMDGDEGQRHPELGGRIMARLFGQEWGDFTRLHSRYYAALENRDPSPLCAADKLVLLVTPRWLYLPLVRLTGEAAEYRALYSAWLGVESVSIEEWYDGLRAHWLYHTPARFAGLRESSQPCSAAKRAICVSSEVKMKRCKICGDIKPFDAFNKNKVVKDGYDNRCKACRKAQRAVSKEEIKAKNRAYYAANAKQLREYAARYRQDNPDTIKNYRERNRDRRLAYAHQYHKVHQEQRRFYTRRRYLEVQEQRIAYSRSYYRENRERVLQSAREYQKRNREKIRIHNKAYRARRPDHYRKLWKGYRQRHAEQVKLRSHLHRARRAQAEGSFTEQEWRDLCAKYGNRCLCCGATGVPLSPDHVIPLSKGGSNYITNLQPLCLPCNLKKSTDTTDYRPKDEP